MEEKIREVPLKKIATLICLIFIAILFATVITNSVRKSDFVQNTIKSYDEKQEMTMALATSSTASAVAISLMPSDIGTSISNELAELSSYFLLILSVIFLEKYMVDILVVCGFRFVFPCVAVLFAISLFKNKRIIRALAVRLLVFGIVLVSLLPLSASLSDSLYNTYKDAMEETLVNAENVNAIIEGEIEEESSEDEGFLEGLFSKVTGSVTAGLDRLKTILNDFIEYVAVMIVVNCAIPVAVLVLFIFLSKIIFGFEASISETTKTVIDKRPDVKKQINKIRKKKNNDENQEIKRLP